MFPLSDVKMTGPMMDNCEVLVPVGPFDGAPPYGVSLNGSNFKPVDTSRASELCVGPMRSYR